MSEWAQEQIDAMIAEPKRITVAPKRQMERGRGYQRNGMRLESLDGQRRFVAFLRVNNAFPENFSVGMDVVLGDGSHLCLIRCNGPHEGVAGSEAAPGVPNHHFGYHVHRAKTDNLDAGLRSERGAALTTAYGSFGEAITFFLRACGVQGGEAYFSDLTERRMFDETEAPGE